MGSPGCCAGCGSFFRIACTKSGTGTLNYIPFNFEMLRIPYIIYISAIVFNKHDFECLSHNIRERKKFWGGGGCDTPKSLSYWVYPYNVVGQILKIFERFRLKNNSGRKNFDKFTKIVLKHFTNYGKLF